MPIFAYGGDAADGLECADWRLASASVTGPAHLRTGKPCDDAAAAGWEGAWLVAVVCDGAGSAPHGGLGAKTAAGRIASGLLSSLSSSGESEEMHSSIVAVLEKTHEALGIQAQEMGASLSELATTVVGVVCHRQSGCIFQLGDGLAVAHDGAGAVTAFSRGSPQEYANEAYFLTDRSWRDYLVITPVPECASVALMTDGVTPFACEEGLAKEEFFTPIARYVAAHSALDAANAMRRLLDRDDARKQVGDDKTLLWICRLSAPAHAGDDRLDR